MFLIRQYSSQRMTKTPILHASLPDLRGLQRKRKQVVCFAIVSCGGVLTAVESLWHPAVPTAVTLITNLGLLLIAVCIVGRTWCTLYIGGHKNRELTIHGPYSVVRNPLYVFTIIGAAGIGAQSGTLTVAVLFAAVGAIIFAIVVRQEECFLAATFGDAFAAYATRVPRFWPRLSLWQEAGVVLVSPYLVRRSFLDACVFLIALPVCQLMQDMRDDAWFPLSLRLP